MSFLKEGKKINKKNKKSLLAALNHCIRCNEAACLSQDEGRLLYIGQNEWTHVNCALWSAEVFEDDDGALKNVHMAVLRGKKLVRPSAQAQCVRVCVCLWEANRLSCSVRSTARGVRSPGRPSAAASPRAPVATTSCVLASATAASWRTRRFTAQSTRSSSRERQAHRWFLV